MSNEFGPGDIIMHALSLRTNVHLIDLTTAYLAAPNGSGEEDLAEQALSTAIAEALDRGPNYAGNLMLGLLSLVATVTDGDQVAEWFQGQIDSIATDLERMTNDEPRE